MRYEVKISLACHDVQKTTKYKYMHIGKDFTGLLFVVVL